MDYDRKGLAGLESEVRKAVNTLKRYGDGSMDQILTAFLELKMTAKFRQEWISYHGRPELKICLILLIKGSLILSLINLKNGSLIMAGLN